MSLVPPIRAYEHRGGASGRQIRYRAPRYEARALFSGPFPVAVLGDEPHILCDLSLSGLAVIGTAQGERGAPLREGSEVPVALKLGEALLHEGRGRVARLERTDLGTKVGLSFLGRMLDLEAVAARYRHEILCARLKASVALHEPQPPPEFRVLCADLLDRLHACREVLEVETLAREEPNGHAGDRGLVAMCREAIRPKWKEAGIKANAALESALEDLQMLKAMKSFAERVLTAELAAGPLWQRAYRKPLGYPGDFALAAALNAPPAGAKTLYVAFLDTLARDAFAWLPGQTLALAQAMGRELAQQREAAPFQVASIGCGGGEELCALLLGRGRPARALAVTLIEQDASALSHAYESLAALAIADPARLSLRALHASHAQLEEKGELAGALSGQHLILAPTLFDYLRHRPATQLLDALYRALAPGGLILAACLCAHAGSSRWASELLCDWSMIHRTRDEVYALGTSLARAKIDVRTAAEGDVFLLAIRRPRATC